MNNPEFEKILKEYCNIIDYLVNDTYKADIRDDMRQDLITHLFLLYKKTKMRINIRWKKTMFLNA